MKPGRKQVTLTATAHRVSLRCELTTAKQQHFCCTVRRTVRLSVQYGTSNRIEHSCVTELTGRHRYEHACSSRTIKLHIGACALSYQQSAPWIRTQFYFPASISFPRIRSNLPSLWVDTVHVCILFVAILSFGVGNVLYLLC